MPRKKGRKSVELDEETLKEIYVGKKFVRPVEKELETINEAELEEDKNAAEENTSDQISTDQKVVLNIKQLTFENQLYF